MFVFNYAVWIPRKINVFLYDDTNSVYKFQSFSASTQIKIMRYAEVWLIVLQRLKGI
jgi:hypothetical protein